jgi:ankyrin repeat protein
MANINIFDAVLNNNLANVNTFISAGGNVNIDNEGVTPLQIAVDFGELEIVEALLAAGANPNVELHEFDGVNTFSRKEEENGESALHMAISLAGPEVDNDHFFIVQRLINAGADINKERTDNSDTPLSIAARVNNVEIFNLLLSRGARITESILNNLDDYEPEIRDAIETYMERIRQSGRNIRNVRLALAEQVTGPVLRSNGRIGRRTILTNRQRNNILFMSGHLNNRGGPPQEWKLRHRHQKAAAGAAAGGGGGTMDVENSNSNGNNNLANGGSGANSGGRRKHRQTKKAKKSRKNKSRKH